MINSRELAIAEDPRGEFCNKCHKENHLWDDVGWFYNYIGPLSPKPWEYGIDFDKHYLPVCADCNTTPPGDR